MTAKTAVQQQPPKRLRCAVYTRKSTEHNLDLAFNSLDAQREACEAYVKSQAHEGWALLADRFDDGGLSGASLQRPALQQLLSDIRSARVDIVVVYKVDRLTRSLADFAKLVEEFDAHDVAFVSVTQSFNTTSSMGRLTLNVLLSFAQFEREVIGERVRDKIAASKRKGLWVGGPVPLGYRSVGKALEVIPEQAEIVRTIYERYLAVGSMRLLIEDLHQRGISPCRGSRREPSAGETEDLSPPRPRRFTLGPLAYILKNRIYVGEIAYKGEIHLGRHAPIIERALFDAVQARLEGAAIARRTRRRGTSHLLVGRLYDDRGHHMSPSHATKAGVRYRYYVSQALLQHRKADAGTVARLAAPDIDTLVAAAVRQHLADKIVQDASLPADATLEGIADQDLIAAHVERVTLRAQQVEIALTMLQSEQVVADTAALGGDVVNRGNAREPPADGITSPVLVVPWTPRVGSLRKGISHEPTGHLPIGNEPTDHQRLDPQARAALLIAIGKARGWVDDLRAGRVDSLMEIARREGKGERHIRLLAVLAFVSPKIVAAITAGSAPTSLTVSAVARSLPHLWSEQEQRFGLG